MSRTSRGARKRARPKPLPLPPPKFFRTLAERPLRPKPRGPVRRPPGRGGLARLTTRRFKGPSSRQMELMDRSFQSGSFNQTAVKTFLRIESALPRVSRDAVLQAQIFFQFTVGNDTVGHEKFARHLRAAIQQEGFGRGLQQMRKRPVQTVMQRHVNNAIADYTVSN